MTKDTNLRSNQRDMSVTPNSYTSSIRSDVSPCSFSRTDRRLSETSTNSASQRSIPRSPYEYDIASSASDFHHRSADSANIGALTSHMERTKLDGSLISDPCRFSRGSITRFLAAQRESNDSGIRTNTSTTTPCQTPVPLSEIPPHDVRRASDPARWGVDEVAPSSTRPFQRCHSLNAVRPLPIPPRARAVMRRSPAGVSLMSSHSSIATNYSNQSVDTDFESGVFKTEGKANFDCSAENPATTYPPAFECDDDFLIPDEMQDFLDKTMSSSTATGGPNATADSTIPDSHFPTAEPNVEIHPIEAKASYEPEPRSSCMYEKSGYSTQLGGSGLAPWDGSQESSVKFSKSTNESAAKAYNCGNSMTAEFDMSQTEREPFRGLPPSDDFVRPVRYPAIGVRDANRAYGSANSSVGASLHQSVEGPRLSNQWYRTQPRSGRMGVAPGEPFPGFSRIQFSGPMIARNQVPSVVQFGNSCPSPHVQVPQISQSQMSPRLKAPNSRTNPHAAAAAAAAGQMCVVPPPLNSSLYPSDCYPWPVASHQGNRHSNLRVPAQSANWSHAPSQSTAAYNQTVGSHPKPHHLQEGNQRQVGAMSGIGSVNRGGFGARTMPVMPGQYSQTSPNCNQVCTG